MSIYNKCITDILKNLILKWLLLKDLIKLDSATCNKFDRTILNGIYHEKSFIFNNTGYYTNDIDWFNLRQIKYAGICLSDNYVNGQVIPYKNYKKCTFMTNNINNVRCIRICVRSLRIRRLPKLIKKCDNLNVLIYNQKDSDEIGFISKNALHKLIINNHNLLFISLKNCADLNNIVNKIANNCYQLKTLMVDPDRSYKIIHAKTFVNLMTNCKFLTTLLIGTLNDFYENNNTVNKYANKYINYQSNNKNNNDDNYLTTLGISTGIIDINDIDVINSLNKCKIKNLSLQSYDRKDVTWSMDNINTISRINFEILVNKCDLLVSLELDFCWDENITENYLMKIVDKCVALKSLLITCNHSSGTGEYGFTEILKKCKSLKKIRYFNEHRNNNSMIDIIHEIANNCDLVESLTLFFGDCELSYDIFTIIFEKCKLLKDYIIKLGYFRDVLKPETIQNFPQFERFVDLNKKVKTNILRNKYPSPY